MSPSSAGVPAKRNALFTFFVFVVLASLDNAAAGVLPPLYAIIARDFGESEVALGFVTAAYIMVLSLAAVVLGYRGDRSNRKWLLLGGTLLWAGAMIFTGLANNFRQFLLGQLLTAVGVGGVAAVGFSVISDLIPPQRRAFAFSLWSMSQFLGSGLGALLASTLGASDWHLPFFVIAALGLLFAFLYLFAQVPGRGQSETELAPVYAAGESYQYQIQFSQLATILKGRSNRWLMLQNFLFALAIGSTIWVPRWAIARVQAEGYGLAAATTIGNIFVIMFNVGVFFAIPAGHLGDRWQQKRPSARALLAAIGLLGAVPLFILLFFFPLRNISVPADGNFVAIGWAIIQAIFTNGWVAGAFVIALAALMFLSAEGPNRAAILTDVNLPEHRGTIIGFNRLASALGNGISISVAGLVIAQLNRTFAPPTNYAVGLSLFQLLLIPAALCYFAISRTVAADKQQIKTTLAARAATVHD